MSDDGVGGYRPYPEYKDSGIEWLGGIPTGWKVKRLKHLCFRSALYGANISATEYSLDGVRFLRTTDISDDGQLASEDAVYVPEASVREYLLEDNDLLFSRSGTLGRSFRYTADVHGPCAYAGYLVRFVPDHSLDAQFAFYYTRFFQTHK